MSEKIYNSETETIEDGAPKRFYTQTWFVILSAVLSVVLIFGIIVGVAIGVFGYSVRELFGMEAKKIDFLNDSLDKYITIETDDYKNYDIEINLIKPGELQLENRILRLIAQNKGKLMYDGKYQTKKPITPADRVDIYYAAYILDENGRRVEVTGMNNYGDQNPYSLTIGSGTFPDGFELGLIGKTPNPGFESFNYGDVMDGDVVYATMSYIKEDGIVHYDEAVRIDLGDENVEELWGEGIFEHLSKTQVGLINDEIEVLQCKESKESIIYTQVIVDYITRCEDENVITLETQFPYAYEKDGVRSEKVYFDVYVEQVLCYENDEFDETFILEKLELTEEFLASYEGDGITEKCKSYYREVLLREFEKNCRSAAEEKMWQILKSNVKIKKYPATEVDRIYEDYVYSYKVSFLEQNEEGLGYSDLDEFIAVQLGLEEGANWSEYLLDMVKDELKEKLIFYTIIRRENLVPKGDEFDAVYKRELELDFEYYYEKTKDDYKTDAEYEAALADFEKMILDYYGEDFYTDSVYYNYATDKLLAFANIINVAENDN